jgi:NAD(P)-dependent dehydrogenase (short-subunit alcohol dehydrogenase family)
MGGAGKLPWKMDDAHFGQVIDTNVKGVFYVQKYFIQSMLDDLVSHPDRGVTKRVINTSSGVGHSTSPVLAEYSTSKWGVEALSKSTAQGFNVLRDSPKTSDAMKKACGQILCVPLAPGVIGTEMNRTKGLPTAADWCSTAVDFILSIPVSESGSSLSVPGFYGAEYRSTWVIPDGMKLPTKWVNPS